MSRVDLTKMLTTAEFAERVSLAVDTVKRYCQRGIIIAEKFGGTHGVWMIPSKELERFKKERRSAGRPKES